ncbi:MAG: hypothetical protein RLZZ587_1074 [Actinomycetota bacterium]
MSFVQGNTWSNRSMVIYRERLTPNVGIHLALLLLVPLGFGMLAPINITWGAINAVGLYLIGVAWLTLGAPQIVITEVGLRVGRAAIDRTFLGEVELVERADRPAALSDARAWKVIRAWIPCGVRLTITDENDPTPYWYFSTRKPEAVIAALAKR